MTELARALLDSLDDEAVAELARRLAPYLQAETTEGPLEVPAAATRCGVSPRTIRRALEAGTLDGTKVTGRWKILPDALGSWQAAGGPTLPEHALRTPTTPPRRAAVGTRGVAVLREEA